MLVGKNALESDINQTWQQDNQAWWDWYVTLAENSDQHNDDTLVQLPPDPHLTAPTDYEIEEELVTPYNLTLDHCQSFRRDGFIKLPNVLSCGAVARLRSELLKLLYKVFAVNITTSGDSNRFLSLEMMWLERSEEHTSELQSRL